MKIIVDADACPVKKQIEMVAKEYNLKVIYVVDTSHIIDSEFAEVVTVSKGTDAADFALINIAKEGDIVVTQDYGVAAMALSKRANPIHQSGKWYTSENIDYMLMERHIARQARRKSAKNHIKGPKKRTDEDNQRFLESLIKLTNHLLN